MIFVAVDKRFDCESAVIGPRSDGITIEDYATEYVRILDVVLSGTSEAPLTEIAAALMGMEYEPVLAEVKKTSRLAARTGIATRVIAGEQGAQRAVVVERRVIRKRVAT